MTLRTLGLVLLIFPLPGVAADIAAGEALHASECIACHKSLMGGEANTIYTREERRIHSYDSLLTQRS
jgi:cytochrome c